MNATLIRGSQLVATIVAGILMLASSPPAQATIAYNNPGPFVAPQPNAALPRPWQVNGKEYSHDPDQSAAPPGGGLDPARVIAWDGFGGTADGVDHSLPAPPFSTSGIFEVDAIANTHDALFKSLVRMQNGQLDQPDMAHLVYSIDDAARTSLANGLLPISVPAAGPVVLPANIIGGAGEISYELAGAFHPANSHGLWASQTDVNGMPTPRDVDGLELWGPEPKNVPIGSDASAFADSDKYSVDTDISTGVGGAFSVWNYDTSGGTGSTPYVGHALVTALVQSLLDEPNLNPELINLDALMVQDDVSLPTRFDPGDKIIFSIRQVAATFAADGSGFQTTGSEIFWMDGASTVAAPVGNFLFHGGHLWDKAYALTHMTTVLMGPEGQPVKVQLDLNALEAVGSPEPTSALLMLIGVLAISGFARRSRFS